MSNRYYASVILPCYNKEKFISKTLNSLINQTIFNKLELICIDDCSTDNTLRILKQFSKKYKNIKVFKNKANSQVYITRLNGIEYANGEYIGFLDPDDWVDNTWFEELYKKAKETNADILQTPHVIKWYSNEINEDAFKWFRNMETNIININENNISDTVKNNWMTLWNRLFKSEILKPLLNLPRYRICFLEDMLIYWCALINSSIVCNYVSNSKMYYNLSKDVEHLSSTQHNKREQPTAMVFNIIDSYIISTGKTEYIKPVKKWRKYYIENYANSYLNMFNMEEGFSMNSVFDEYERRRNENILKSLI